MFERYTETARRTLFFARHEAGELGGTTIEAEDLLLGLLRADEGPLPQLFARANLSYTVARTRIRAHRGVHERLPRDVDMPFTEETQRIILSTVEEADRLGQTRIGTGLVLLAILREEGSFAAEILRSHGITVDDLREQIVKMPPDPDPPHEAVPEGVLLALRLRAFDPVGALERTRVLAELLVERPDGADARLLLDEIHHHVDALKQHLA